MLKKIVFLLDADQPQSSTDNHCSRKGEMFRIISRCHYSFEDAEASVLDLYETVKDDYPDFPENPPAAWLMANLPEKLLSDIGILVWFPENACDVQVVDPLDRPQTL